MPRIVARDLANASIYRASRINGRLNEALQFEAPYVIDRLVKNRVAGNPAAARILFTELKKYFVLCELAGDATYGMSSVLVDEAWHAFILFTTEYTDYGLRYFGKYLVHAPAVDRRDSHRRDQSSFNDFRQQYEVLFNEQLPEVWYDSSNVTCSRRVINDRVGRLTLNRLDRIVELIDNNGATLMSVSELAAPALDFVAETSDFYVRELPGNLTDEEKTGLARALNRLGVLRLAP